jgi:HEAT repeat protein
VRTSKPNIKSLARRHNVAELVDAAAYSDVEPGAPAGTIDSGIPVRAEAILALGALGHDAGPTAVRAGLRDAADSVRCAAVRVLHARHDGVALAEALGSLPTDGESRELAILALADLKDSMSASVLVTALVHGQDEELLDEQVARLCLELIEAEQPGAQDAAIRRLVQALADERGIVADRAAELLVRLAPTSIEALVTALGPGSAAANAAYVLGRIGDPQTVGPMVEALRHEDARVRRECAAALGGFAAREAVMPLLRATHDRDHGVRVQAAAALDRMGTSAVIVGVAALLEPMIHEAVRSARAQQRRRDLAGQATEAMTPRPAIDRRAG